jgi:hypothetical protein
MASPVFFVDRQHLVAVALDHRLPSMFAFRQWVDEGGEAVDRDTESGN